MTVKKFLQWSVPVLLVLLTIAFWNTILKLEYIPTESMSPTIPASSLRIFNLTAFWGNTNPARNDIVLFWSQEDNKYLVKRIAGTSGDTIQIFNDHININGLPVPDTNAIGDNLKNIDTEAGFIEYVVPAGTFFMLGDNREASLDSRFWENPYILQSDIKGELL